MTSRKKSCCENIGLVLSPAALEGAGVVVHRRKYNGGASVTARGRGVERCSGERVFSVLGLDEWGGGG